MHRRHLLQSFLLALTLLAPAIPGQQAQTQTAAKSVAAQDPIYFRLAVIGASGSAGFNTQYEVEEDVPLAEFLSHGLRLPHEEPLNFSSSFFFLNPKPSGESQVKSAKAVRPTAVVALDFLFWYAYGTKKNPQQRFEDLEEGMSLLGSFRCPVFVTTLPDMTPAIGTMLSRSQVPKPENLAKLNQRLLEWVDDFDHVHLVPMTQFLDDLRAGKAVATKHFAWPKNSESRLLQRDHLHPTVEGMGALSLLVLEALDQLDGDSTATPYLFQPLSIRDAVAAHRGLAWTPRGYLPQDEVQAAPSESEQSPVEVQESGS